MWCLWWRALAALGRPASGGTAPSLLRNRSNHEATAAARETQEPGERRTLRHVVLLAGPRPHELCAGGGSASHPPPSSSVSTPAPSCAIPKCPWPREPIPVYHTARDPPAERRPRPPSHVFHRSQPLLCTVVPARPGDVWGRASPLRLTPSSTSSHQPVSMFASCPCLKYQAHVIPLSDLHPGQSVYSVNLNTAVQGRLGKRLRDPGSRASGAREAGQG